MCVCFLGAAIRKYHSLGGGGGGGGLHDGNLFSYHSGGRKPKIKVLAGLLPSESSLRGSQMAAFSLRPHMSLSSVRDIPGVCVSKFPLLARTPPAGSD